MHARTHFYNLIFFGPIMEKRYNTESTRISIDSSNAACGQLLLTAGEVKRNWEGVADQWISHSSVLYSSTAA
jgi:hypothetical protein